MLTWLLLLMDVCLKYLIVGTRHPGSFPWDTDTYCQRWKLYTQFRDAIHGETNILRGMGGSWYINQYFRLLGADIGRGSMKRAIMSGSRSIWSRWELSGSV